ncbi:MAG: serine/threonine-protein phosphatase [Defluviitaleaceae bacterium]|nr:serine/threonine-protein phosphatase [Defluviitaleaceae bacterium]
MLSYEAKTYLGTRPSNQDRMYAKTGEIVGQSCGLFAIADGMGGLKDGHIAAEIAVEAVSEWWKKKATAGANDEAEAVKSEFCVLFAKINDAIIAHANTQSVTLGTTLSLLFICNNTYHIAHTGDTRIYLTQKRFFRKKTLLLTQDQTWGADKIRENAITPKEIHMYPKKNMLTGCLGVFEAPKMFFATGELKKSATFTLCSDGLYRVIPTPTNTAENLIATAQALNTKDNASVIVVNHADLL